MSTVAPPCNRTPKSAARRAVFAASALAIRVFVGMQPVFTQVPPNNFRSTTAIFMPASTKRAASDGPACPVPMMMASNFCIFVTSTRATPNEAGSSAVFYGTTFFRATRNTWEGCGVSLQIDTDVVAGPGTADQHVAVRRRIDRIGPIADCAEHKSGLTSVTDPGAARPSHRYVARLGQLEQALERRPHRTLRPLRANETSGPAPGGPAGKCAGRRGDAATPGVRDGAEPKISVRMQLAAIPQAARPAVRSRMKVGGPQM